MRDKNFTVSDIGSSVVFAGFDGGSYSAKIQNVTRDSVRIVYFPCGPRPVFATVVPSDYSRLTKFAPKSNFMTLEVL